jgi:hypothetical protein
MFYPCFHKPDEMQARFLQSHRNVLLLQKLFHVADRAGAEMENARGVGDGWNFRRLHSFSVGVKGRPRSPLNSFFNRRSLELVLRRLIPGATSWLLSRRARRPFSQSSQLIEPSSGMQGTFDFEFIGDFFHQLNALWKITVFRQIRKPPALGLTGFEDHANRRKIL